MSFTFIADRSMCSCAQSLCQVRRKSWDLTSIIRYVSRFAWFIPIRNVFIIFYVVLNFIRFWNFLGYFTVEEQSSTQGRLVSCIRLFQLLEVLMNSWFAWNASFLNSINCLAQGRYCYSHYQLYPIHMFYCLCRFGMNIRWWINHIRFSLKYNFRQVVINCD